MSPSVHGVGIPDSKIAREITELVRDTESPLLFHHSSRVYYFGALAGKHRGLSFDSELLYSSDIPSATSPSFTLTQPQKIVPSAHQSAKPCSFVTATSSSVHSLRTALSP
jgi:hypothetical protein